MPTLGISPVPMHIIRNRQEWETQTYAERTRQLRAFEDRLAAVFRDCSYTADPSGIFSIHRRVKLENINDEYLAAHGHKDIFEVNFELDRVATAAIMGNQPSLVLAELVNAMIYASLTKSLGQKGVDEYFILDRHDEKRSFNNFMQRRRIFSKLLEFLDHYTCGATEGRDSWRTLTHQEKNLMIKAFFVWIDPVMHYLETNHILARIPPDQAHRIQQALRDA